MSKYVPDKWLIIKTDVGGLHYRVLATWYGGYTTGDSWKMSSGIVSILETETDYEITNTSGSLYICNKNCLGMSAYTTSIYENYKSMYKGDLFEITTTQEVPLGDAKYLCKDM